MPAFQGGRFIYKKGVYYTVVTFVAFLLLYLMSNILSQHFAGDKVVSSSLRTEYFLLIGYSMLFGVLCEANSLFFVLFEGRIRFHWTLVPIVLGAIVIFIPYWDWTLVWFGSGTQNLGSTLSYPLHLLSIHLVLGAAIGSLFIRSLRNPVGKNLLK